MPSASWPRSFRPSGRGATGEVQRMAPEEVCSADMFVLIPLARPGRGSSLVTTGGR